MVYVVAVLVFLMSGQLFAQDYSELAKGEQVQTRPLLEAVEVPNGYSREPVESGSFAHYLRHLPVRLDRTNVLAFDGRAIKSPSAHVILMDVGTRDLQQCADSAIRLHAEWLWSTKQLHHLQYHFTSGDLSTWHAWANGERFRIKGANVTRVTTHGADHSRQNFRRWLETIFMYAGTGSLPRDSVAVKPTEVRAGDFFNQGGSPGHVVIVLDVAIKDGKRVALLGQGFMPAQDFHVLKSSKAIDSVWFHLPAEAEAPLVTPSWPAFYGKDARRFKHTAPSETQKLSE
jgi:hypothetical protein